MNERIIYEAVSGGQSFVFSLWSSVYELILLFILTCLALYIVLVPRLSLVTLGTRCGRPPQNL